MVQKISVLGQKKVLILDFAPNAKNRPFNFDDDFFSPYNDMNKIRQIRKRKIPNFEAINRLFKKKYQIL